MAKKTYHDSELEHVPAVMLGGPIDGKGYRMPVFPDGGVPTAFSTPLQQPHESSPRAVYLREARCAGWRLLRVLLRPNCRLEWRARLARDARSPPREDQSGVADQFPAIDTDADRRRGPR